jgi:hypothetical protein
VTGDRHRFLSCLEEDLTEFLVVKKNRKKLIDSAAALVEARKALAEIKARAACAPTMDDSPSGSGCGISVDITG